VSAANPAEVDGRRLRSQGSRARIVAAMLGLIRDGEISPSAEQVAWRAGVGLRTVFRHFSDMASLYREMHEAIETELRTVAATPFRGRTWRERLLELVDRRAVAFDAIAPFRRAADVRRRGSTALQADHARLAEGLREILTRVAPEALRRDPARFEALDLLLSYEAWSRLRDDQGLSPRAARAALAAAVGALIGPED
jgi:AcrR family transcriptional regulator